MVIQKILFPEIGKCTEQELYFRRPHPGDYVWAGNRAPEDMPDENCGGGSQRYPYEKDRISYHYSEGFLALKEGERIGFDTYFNGFSIDKWRKYTILDNLSLSLTIQGRLKITLFARQKIHENVIEKILGETILHAVQKQTCELAFPIKDAKGMLCFEIEALEDGGILYTGAYCSKVPAEKLRDIKLGIGICTFRREAFIEKNLHILRKDLLEKEDSPLYGHLEVFIADNGKSLDKERLENHSIHIFPNRNLGGSGGFTRNLVEMKKGRQRYGITHALLMDDDVVIEPEALVKTYMLLALMKEEYRDAFIGGAMLRLDRQAFQTEAGAAWNAGVLNSLKKGLDLRSCEACLYNEIEEHAEYHAWWYCCFPMDIVTPRNLPLPLFIRGDDVEYGLRNMKHLIVMNGICIWHEPFECKYASFLEYYIIRNQLITNAFHCPGFGARQLNRLMLSHCLREITYYRYKNVDLYLQGICDFLKGPQWLMEQDGEALHQQVVQSGYQMQEADSLDMGFYYPVYEASRHDFGQNSRRSRRILTLNGLLLPAKGDNIAPAASAIGVHFYRNKRVMNYDIASHKGFITERSFRMTMKYLRKVLRMVLTNSLQLKQAQKAYRTDGGQLRMWKFWKGYLEDDAR